MLSDRLTYSLMRLFVQIDYNGNVEPVLEEHHMLNKFVHSFEERFLSFAIESECDATWFTTSDGTSLTTFVIPRS